jgi:hypothetical protein
MLSCGNYLEICELQHLGSLRVCRGLYRDCIAFITKISVNGISKCLEDKKGNMLEREQK